MNPSPSLLHLLHLASPALPVGAYAYSQGLEYAIDGQWLQNEKDLKDWLTGVLHHGLGGLDLPVLLRIKKAWQAQDKNAVIEWNDFIRAARETRELLLEDEQMGAALQRLLISLEVEHAGWVKPPTFVSQFALAAKHWRLTDGEALYGLAYSWLENQIAAATKLVPLGQTQAQKLLVSLLPEVEVVCAQAAGLEDDELGVSLPGLAMASCAHERQYSRLFRS